MPYTEAQVERLMGLVEKHLATRFGSDAPHWEEILAEGRLGAWRALAKVAETDACKATTAATRGAMWAAMNYVRGAQGGQPTTRNGCVRPRVVSLESLVGAAESEGDASDLPPKASEVMLTPDIAIDSIERLALDERLQEALVTDLTDEEYEVIRRTVMEGSTCAEASVEMGISRRRVEVLRRGALARLRAGSDWREEKRDGN